MSEKAKFLRKVGVAVAALVVPGVLLFEGTVYEGYRDPIGIVTACTGHTETAQLGRRYTPAECEQLLYRDLLKHADDLQCIKVPLKDHEKAAFISFSFNVGREKFCGSSLVRKANAGDLIGACAELSRWVWAGDRKLQGLVKRRAHERALCEGKGS
ncbi:lysozyme [Aquabacterium sp. A7-Y]|uniref:lysozyme n=1 Tax=Aquabacterium sp. A7-Y TaxID=1349605 RepID=UPI00223E80E1|nr:lysozyme [Aquabacterium sp. A7-Y]MCW7541873.1 lysozyme [Aquabacterium sp. A7-Y]